MSADPRLPELKAAHDEMANAILRTLRSLQTAVAESPMMLKMWRADPVTCIGIVISTIEARHLRGADAEALVDIVTKAVKR